MIRVTCPKCATVLKVSADHVGKKPPCPRCGERLQVPAPPPPPANKAVLGVLTTSPAELFPDLLPAALIPEDPPPSPFDPIDGPRPRRRRRHERPSPSRRAAILIGLGIGGLSILGVGILLAVREGRRPPSPPNAKCPGCGHRFHVRDDLRGTAASAQVRDTCPNCGLSGPLASFYHSGP